MTRYFFNLEGENSKTADLVGRDLADEEVAKAQAVRFAAEFDSADEITGLLAYDWVEVLDQSQRPVARFPLGHSNDEPDRSR